MCNSRQTIKDNILSNIYDGQIWKKISDKNNSPFFTYESIDTYLKFMLNLDWFQPFDGTQYSINVIYMVIYNLPRDI